MSDLAIPALGLLNALMGIIFLVGCFVRVDSPPFIERAAGSEQKIARLHSLQDSWNRLGRLRQFIASSSGFLIMGAGLLLVWRKPELARFFWVVPVAYFFNLLALLWVRKYAVLVLATESTGGSEVLRVIKRNIRICITFSIIYVLLVAVA